MTTSNKVYRILVDLLASLLILWLIVIGSIGFPNQHVDFNIVAILIAIGIALTALYLIVKLKFFDIIRFFSILKIMIELWGNTRPDNRYEYVTLRASRSARLQARWDFAKFCYTIRNRG